MSLFGALSASLTALTAQSSAVNVISNNISNLSTAGFKSTTTSFSTLIAGDVGGGVLQGLRNDIDKQGAISSTNVGTDLAVQGTGFFTVSDIAGKTLYTRSGSFRTDKDGNLVNEAGYQLMGWRLDSQGRIPGESGNITNTTASTDVRSLSAVSTKSITGVATPTSQITVKANLRADENILRGASASVSLQSTPNANNTANDIIIPSSFANDDAFSVTVVNDGATTTTTYKYGGVEASNDVTDGTGIGGSTTETGIFTSFTDGQSFTIQTLSMDDPVEITFSSSSNTNLREFKNMKELASVLNAIDGVRARIQNGIIYVAADDANDSITFANVTGTLTTSLGFSNIAQDTDSTRFATLGNLADIINTERGEIAAELVNPTGDASLAIYNVDPTGTLAFTDAVETVGGYGTVGFVGTANTSNISTSLIVPTGSGTDTITVALSGGDSYTFEHGGLALSGDISAGIGGVTTTSATFTNAPFVNGAAFTIQSTSMGSPITFTYNSASVTSSNQFRNLDELATIIESASGLRARISDDVLYVAADDANNGLTFTDVSSSGLVAELGFDDDAIIADVGGNRYATMANLETLVDASTGLAATINNPTGAATLTISNTDLTETMTFTDSANSLSVATTAAVADANQLLAEFNLDTDTIDEIYDATAEGGGNMASGTVAPSFSRTVTIYDSLGRSLDMRLSFVKLASDSQDINWGVELYAINPDAIESDRTDGLVAYGTVSFNGDGTLKSITGPSTGNIGSIGGTISIQAKGASGSEITLSLGTAGELGVGKSDGLSQFAGSYTSDVNQNGFPTGQLQSLQIDAQGYVTAIFDNSLTSRVYRLPLATFANPNALTAEAGNAYSANNSSGSQSFGKVGDASVGTIVPGAVESSTAEIGQQLTNLIVAQQAYSASTNVLRKVSDLFDELKNL